VHHRQVNDPAVAEIPACVECGARLLPADETRWQLHQGDASALDEAVTACQGLRNACAHPAAYVRDVGAPIPETVFVDVNNLIDHASGVLGNVLDPQPDPPRVGIEPS
jgi:hypothetical protein